MKIRNIGGRVLDASKASVAFNSFEMKAGSIIPLYIVMDIERPNNVYSKLKLYAIVSRDDVLASVFFLGEAEIRPGRTLFISQVPEKAFKNSDVVITIERVPLVFGTSDTAGTVNLTVSYDEDLID